MNDYAGALTAGERGRLETLLTERERATGAQMVIALFPSLEGESLEDYSIRLAQQWRIGQKSLDNGVILLVFVKDRRVRLEVGYGLEPVIPDAAAGQIIREAIGPRFREGKYAAGLEAAVNAVFERITSKGAPPRRRAQQGLPPLWVLGMLGIFGVIALMLIREVVAGRRFGGGNSYTGARNGWTTPVATVPWWRGGGGGGWSGGGGGGDSGGGFSGGGGDFGGGGASGDW